MEQDYAIIPIDASKSRFVKEGLTLFQKVSDDEIHQPRQGIAANGELHIQCFIVCAAFEVGSMKLEQIIAQAKLKELQCLQQLVLVRKVFLTDELNQLPLYISYMDALHGSW